MKDPNATANLTASINQHLENLAKLTTDAARTDAIRAYVEMCSKFYKYSPFNQILISFSKPDATRVAGYKAWLKFNRHVRRGEHGIAILAPCIYRQDPDDENSPRVLKGFKTAYVFDISQTDGDPLPDPPDWKSPARQAELEDRLTNYAASLSITVTRAALPRNAQGCSQMGTIILAPEAGTKTLIHELAHEILHRGAERLMLAPETLELEAEAVAYVVASHFSLPDLASPNYLALWDADAQKIQQRAGRIQAAACQIIEALEPQTEDL